MSTGRERAASSPTVADVAKAAGVSFATAARALGGYGHVSAKARAAVEAAGAELGYRRNDVARALASGSTRSVGLVVGDIENPFFATVSRGVADVLEPEGYTLLLANSDEDPAREARAIEALRTQVDGLLIAPAASAGAARTQDPGKPLVLLDRSVNGLEADCVTVENAAGATRAVEHLVERGHRRIGIVTSGAGSSSTAQRIRGYRGALKAAGLEIDPAWEAVTPEFTPTGARDAALRLLGAPKRRRVTAVFATDNFMTHGVWLAARELGLKVPDELAVVAFDDIDWLTLVDPQVTAVVQPVMELGREAGRLLLRRLAEPGAKVRRVRLGTELVVRASSG
ncbi:MAG TPA: LacI family DNA-binding transcriptional regulator [Baekduia sp.]|uniref:LacI family DNA-binding transcriptional regulator n=1 Tax=Baekduia sp. TaxID=2600305 RepID=UPI002D7A1AD7|nr:LacI family DNA-binding transcriptional regulator [Baekduia sp.]HET6508155.1 LacI family DNA-binding transcriptional regulator [Baekduia sp.]